jgi:hypothetical protein
MDFITKVPATVDDGSGSGRAGNNMIITFIDLLTKLAQWVSVRKADLTADRFAEILMDMYFYLH